MTSSLGKVVLVSLEPGEEVRLARRRRLVAFLPMTVAIVGAVIALVSGLSTERTQLADRSTLDTMTTGSISSER